MIKRILLYFFVVSILFGGILYMHNFIITSNNAVIRFSLFNIYLFHFISSFIIYLIIELIVFKMPNQAGFVFLASIFLKLGFFVMIFNTTILSLENLNLIERVSIIVPLFIFLFLEAAASFKLLNKL